jgi:hypothetical protein
VLSGPVSPLARLQIPYAASAEYDLVLTVARREGSNSFNVGIASAGRRFSLSMDGWEGGDIGGLDAMDGKASNANEARFQEKVFVDGKPRKVVCCVRRSHVALWVDGKRYVDWKGDFKRLAVAHFGVPDERVPWLLCGSTGYDVSRMTLVPLSGPGQRLR